MDAVGARDLIEVLASLAILSCNISRMAEELMLRSTYDFGIVELADKYSSTSIMPQKKNPDVIELARAKARRVYGDLSAALTMLKASPLTYGKDMQEAAHAFRMLWRR